MEKLRRTYPSSRICMMTDAVLAIVVTVLSLKLTTFMTPKIIGWQNILFFWQETYYHISGFLISYVIIGWFWYLHHLLFIHIRRVNAIILFLNMFQLLLMCCIPFAFEIARANHDNMVAEGFFWTLYAMVIIVFYLMLYWIDRDLNAEEERETKQNMRMIKNDAAVLSLAGCTALIFSYFYPGYSLFFWTGIPLLLKGLNIRFFHT